MIRIDDVIAKKVDPYCYGLLFAQEIIKITYCNESSRATKCLPVAEDKSKSFMSHSNLVEKSQFTVFSRTVTLLFNTIISISESKLNKKQPFMAFRF